MTSLPTFASPARVGRIPSILTRAAAVLAVAALAWLVFLLSASGLSYLLGAAALGLAFTVIIWVRPFWGLLTLVTVGTAHSFLMMLFYHLVGSVTLLKAAQLWKEVVLVVVLIKAVEQTFRRRQLPRLYFLDLAILVFIGFGVFYLAYPSSLPGVTFFAKAMGLRADAFFLVAYFVGRLLDLKPSQVRSLLMAFGVVTLIVTAIAVVQFIRPETLNDAFNQLGFQEYMLVQRGDLAVQDAVRDRQISGIDLPRASSILLSDLVLAFYTLLAAPLAIAAFLTFESVGKKAVAGLLMVASAGTTFLTVTRSAILALIPSLGATALVSRRYYQILFLLLQAVVAALLTLSVTGLSPRTLRQLFSPNEASVRGHIRALEESLEIVREEPLGRGLGTAGQIAQRFKPQGAITNESWYLQIATEMGVVPALIYAFILFVFGMTALARHAQVTDPWLKSLCLGLAGATMALGLVGLVLHAWEGLTISIIFWLFAGMVMRAGDLDRQEEAGEISPVA